MRGAGCEFGISLLLKKIVVHIHGVSEYL